MFALPESLLRIVAMEAVEGGPGKGSVLIDSA